MYYTLAVTFTVDRLRALQNLIRKIDTESREGDITDDVIVNMRLTADMFPFSKQVQIASDNAKGMAARLAGKEVPSYEDNEKSLAELDARIEKTINFLETLTEADFV